MTKVTPAYLKSLIVNTEYVHQGVLTICTLTLKNGFNVVGTSACVDESNYNQEVGDKVAFEDAFDKIWVLEGYLLKQKMYEQKQPSQVKLRNGNAAQIVHESDFGKLLVVEFNGDELPPTHWHNADGSYWADAQSDLDIVEGVDGLH
ncbi:Gp49 family protein [Pasteurellaceae bacterium 22721_9_1]